jgi:hypothetical protein
MGWGFVWIMFVLKIPLIALLWLVWWAVQQTDEEAELPRDDGGNDRHPHHRPGPRRPRPPRRGPHAEPPPAPPTRVRVHGKRLPAPLR